MYFYVLLYYCHRANTQLQLNKYIYIYIYIYTYLYLKHVLCGEFLMNTNENLWM
jgi:hypothetical protein